MRLNDTAHRYQPRHLARVHAEALTASQTRRARDMYVIEHGQTAYDELAFATSERSFPQHRKNDAADWALNVIRGGCEKHHWRGDAA